jgi:NAD(P)-dependent dehydrogenase (short-subunit alcohol dehydrogenase family)
MQFPKLTSIEEIAQVNLAAAVALVKGLRELAEIQARHPLGPGSPEDVAACAAFLLADSGRWIAGTTVVVDGGFTAR